MITSIAAIQNTKVLDLFNCDIQNKKDFYRYKNAFHEFKPKLNNYEFIIPKKNLEVSIKKIKEIIITMEEKLIIRLSNNIGNQMFMFAAGYATSKLLKRKFYFDNLSSYKSRKNIYTYALDGFEIPGNIFSSKDNFTNISGYLRRKIKKKIDPFLKKKSFILEKYHQNKETEFKAISTNQSYKDTLYMEGYFEKKSIF